MEKSWSFFISLLCAFWVVSARGEVVLAGEATPHAYPAVADLSDIFFPGVSFFTNGFYGANSSLGSDQLELGEVLKLSDEGFAFSTYLPFTLEQSQPNVPNPKPVPRFAGGPYPYLRIDFEGGRNGGSYWGLASEFVYPLDFSERDIRGFGWVGMLNARVRSARWYVDLSASFTANFSAQSNGVSGGGSLVTPITIVAEPYWTTSLLVSPVWLLSSRFATGVAFQWNYQSEFDRTVNGSTVPQVLAHHSFPLSVNFGFQTGARSLLIGTIAAIFGADSGNSFNPVFSLGFKIYD